MLVLKYGYQFYSQKRFLESAKGDRLSKIEKGEFLYQKCVRLNEECYLYFGMKMYNRERCPKMSNIVGKLKKFELPERRFS